jgi:hypothetical protein
MPASQEVARDAPRALESKAAAVFTGSSTGTILLYFADYLEDPWKTLLKTSSPCIASALSVGLSTASSWITSWIIRFQEERELRDLIAGLKLAVAAEAISPEHKSKLVAKAEELELAGFDRRIRKLGLAQPTAPDPARPVILNNGENNPPPTVATGKPPLAATSTPTVLTSKPPVTATDGITPASSPRSTCSLD